MAKLPVNVLTVSDNLSDSAISHAIYLERFKTREVSEITKVLNDEINPELLNILKKQLGTGTVTEAKLKQMSKAMSDFTGGSQQVLYQKLKADMGDFAIAESDMVANAIDGASPINLNVSTPSPATLRALIGKKPMEGKFVKEWFGDLGKATSNKISQQMRIGMGLGESINKMSKRVIGTAAQGYKDGLLAEQQRHLKTLVRTTVANVSNNVRDEVYKENDDVVKGVEILATLDARTSAICRSEDGNIYPVDSGPRPPFHPNCRTTTIPVLKSWKELGIDLKEAPKSTRASMNGQVSSKQTYGKWLKKQPKGVQEDVLGIAKAKLFRAGKTDMSSFVDARGKTLTLDQLSKVETARAVRIEGLSEKQVGSKIKELIGELEGATDKSVKSRIRRQLRKLGHTGGLVGGKVKPSVRSAAPKVAPTTVDTVSGDIKESLAVRVDRRFKQLKGKYPKIFAEGTISKKFPARWKNAAAIAGDKGRPYRLIELNSRFWGSKSKINLNKTCLDMRRRKWLVGKTAEDLITHEVGHQVKDSLTKKQRKIYQTWWANQQFGDSMKKLEKSLSKYAISDADEMFAELFVKLETGTLSAEHKLLMQRLGLVKATKVVAQKKIARSVVKKTVAGSDSAIMEWVKSRTADLRSLDSTALYNAAKANNVAPSLLRQFRSSASFWKKELIEDIVAQQARKQFGFYATQDPKLLKRLLTFNEQTALMDWQSNTWRVIRRDWLKKTADVMDFRNAIDALPKFKGTMYRGGVVGAKDVVGAGTLKSKLKVGKTIQFKKPASATKNVNVAKEFAGTKAVEDGGRPYILNLQTKGAPDLSGLSLQEFKYQKEVLIQANTKYKVKKIIPRKGKLKHVHGGSDMYEYDEIVLVEI